MGRRRTFVFTASTLSCWRFAWQPDINADSSCGIRLSDRGNRLSSRGNRVSTRGNQSSSRGKTPSGCGEFSLSLMLATKIGSTQHRITKASSQQRVAGDCLSEVGELQIEVGEFQFEVGEFQCEVGEIGAEVGEKDPEVVVKTSESPLFSTSIWELRVREFRQGFGK